MTPTAEHRARIAAVQSWLAESGWTVDQSALDDTAVVERATRQWYAGTGARGRARAERLVARAARLARGERVRSAGRPRKWLRVPVEPDQPPLVR